MSIVCFDSSFLITLGVQPYASENILERCEADENPACLAISDSGMSVVIKSLCAFERRTLCRYSKKVAPVVFLKVRQKWYLLICTVEEILSSEIFSA